MMAQSQSENVRLGEDGESVVLLDQTRLPRPGGVPRGEEAGGDGGGHPEPPGAGRARHRHLCRVLPVRPGPPDGAGGWTPPSFERAGAKGKTLVTSRPTAVNLSWAVERMLGRASGLAEGTSRELADALEAESRAIRPGGRGDVPRHRGARALPAEGGGRGADPLQCGAPGHLPLRHRPGPHPAGPGAWDPPAGIRRRDPAPAPGGAAHRLGAVSGGGGRHPDL